MLSMSEYFRSVSESPQVAQLVTTAYKNLDELSDSEVMQFFCWAFAYFRLVELAHHHFQQGHIKNSFWKGQTEQLAGFMTMPAITRFWELPLRQDSCRVF